MKIYFDMVGCRLNQSEIELMANLLRSQGHEILPDSHNADIIIVNTCCVTVKAAAESRKIIRRAARGLTVPVIVTGCWATMFAKEALALPNVVKAVPNHKKADLVADILGVPASVLEKSQFIRKPLLGERHRTRAFIKVQDGCDNHCTFCITCLARGSSKSTSIALIERDIKAAIQGGVQEIVLTGVQLGSWGKDMNPKAKLRSLLERILSNHEIKRLRLSSIEPWDIDASFFELWQDKRFCRHLHIPLQSGSARILNRMARKTNPDEYQALIESARMAIPGIAITTDIIAGFPGETAADFEESMTFVQLMNFAGGHVFTYSAMPGTPAATFAGQVEYAERKNRNRLIKSVLAKSSKKYKEGSIGETYDVLWEKAKPVDSVWQLSGLTDTYQRVVCTSSVQLTNSISRVRIDRLSENGLKLIGIIT